MKKIISLILAALCFVTVFCSCNKNEPENTNTTAAATEKKDDVYTEGDFNYVKLDNGTVKIVSYNNAQGKSDLDIPTKLGGMNVSVIGANAFTEAQKVTKVRLPRYLTKIESYAFNKSSVAYVWFHQTTDDTKLVVESFAFSECDNLIQVLFSNAVARIEESAFYLGKTPRQITFTADPEYIDANALDTGASYEKLRLCHRGDISNYKNLKAFADLYGIEPILAAESTETN